MSTIVGTMSKFSNDIDIQIDGIWCIINAIYNSDESKNNVFETGAHHIISKAVLKFQSSAELQYVAALALSQSAKCEQVQLRGGSTIISQLVLILRNNSNNERIVNTVLVGLYRFSLHTHNSTLLLVDLY